MTLEEQSLIEAIESKNHDAAIEALKVFSEVEAVSDEQANAYYEQIQDLNTEESVEEESIDLGSKSLDELKALCDANSVSYTTLNKRPSLIKKLSGLDNILPAVEVVPEVVEAPRVEKRGLKPKTRDRKELEAQFKKTYEMSVDYFAQVRKENSAESKFASRMVKRLRLINKQIVLR